MHNAATVYFRKAVCNLNRDADRLPLLEFSFLMNVLFQRDAVHKLHDDVVEPVRVFHLIDIHQIGVRKLRSGQGLLGKTLNKIRVVVILFLEHLDCDRALHFVTKCAVHFRHTAATYELYNFIAIL